MKEENKISLNALSESIEEDDEVIKSTPVEPEIFFDVMEEESIKPATKKSRKKNRSVDSSSDSSSVDASNSSSVGASATTQSSNQSPNQSDNKKFSETFVSTDINDQLENYLITVYNNPDSPDYNDDIKLENYVNELESKLKAESETKKKVREQQVKEQKIASVSSRSEDNIKTTLTKTSDAWLEATLASYSSLKNKYEEELASFYKKYDGIFLFPVEARIELDNIRTKYPLYIIFIDANVVENKIKSFAKNKTSFVLNNYTDKTLDDRVKILKDELKTFDYNVQLKDELLPLIKSRSKIF